MKTGKPSGEAENTGITNAVFEDTLKQENLSREFIRQITNDNEAGRTNIQIDPKVSVPKSHVEVPKVKPGKAVSEDLTLDMISNNASTKIDAPEIKTGLKTVPADTGLELPKLDIKQTTNVQSKKADSLTPTGMEIPTLGTSDNSMSHQIEEPKIQTHLQEDPILIASNIQKPGPAVKQPSGEIQMPKIHPQFEDASIPSRPDVALRSKDPLNKGSSKDATDTSSSGNAARKMIHSTLNCHIPVEDEQSDRTEVVFGNMDKELQDRVMRHVNKYWNAQNPMPSIYPILLKLEREIGPGWRLDKIQTEKYIRADAVVKSTVNFKVSPDSTIFSIWRQQVPTF